MSAYRPAFFLPTLTEKRHIEQMREVLEESRKLLEQPVPDTFLGRQTHEPFLVRKMWENRKSSKLPNLADAPNSGEQIWNIE